MSAITRDAGQLRSLTTSGPRGYRERVDNASEHAPLPDVTGLSFAAMRARRDSALARSLKQVITSLDDPNGVISAFQSFASDS